MGKQILSLCCWLLVGWFPFFSYSQDWNWLQSAGAPAGDIYNNREKGFEIAVDPEGNFLVIGSFDNITTLGNFSLSNVESEGGYLDVTDLFVGKLDSLGNWLWVTQVPGNFYDGYILYYRLFGLAVDADGNAYISGRFNNSVTFGDTQLTGEGIFVAKLNSEGVWQWAEGGFFANDVHCSSISVTDDQQVYITGAYSGAGGFGNVAVTGPPKGIFVAKFDADGNCLWAKGAGGASFGGSGRDVATDQAGNAYISATLKAPAIIDDTISLTGAYTETQSYLCVFKLDGDGHFQWSNVATHCTQPICSGRDIDGYSIDVTADGSRVYVGGTMDGRTPFYFGSLSASGYGNYDFGAIFVAALNGNGQWNWVRTAGGPGVNVGSNFGIDEVFDLRINEVTSQVLVTGYFANSPYAYFGDIYFSGNDLSVAYVAAISASGQWQWVLDGPVAKGTGIDLLPHANMGFITGTIGWECLVARFCLPRNYYYDMDGDGFGNPAETVFQCDPVGSWVTNDEDCNDLDDGINPDAPEVCNGWDDNCDGAIDEGFDEDEDGYTTCAGDCDDENAEIHPETIWYRDADGDGYHDGSTLQQCERPADFRLASELTSLEIDCDDANPDIHPGAPDPCNDIDENCDGDTDEGLVWLKDQDGDGYTDGSYLQECEQPPGYVALEALLGFDIDCDDNNPNIYPGAPEYCNFLDDNCDGQVDETFDLDGDGYPWCHGDCDDLDPDINPNTPWFKDLDGDGFSDGEYVIQCNQPTGFTIAWDLIDLYSDCDDEDASVNPLAPEICNGRDDNCDGAVDEGTEGSMHDGDVFFDNQEQVEQWLSCFTKIDGDLTVMGTVKSLGPLEGLLEVTGSIFIVKSSLTGMEGLDALQTIGGDLVVWKNRKLTTLEGLNRLELVRGDLQILSNSRLWDCCPIEALLQSDGVAGSVKIHQNDTGCESVPGVLAACGDLLPEPVWIGSGSESGNVASVLVLELYPNPVRHTLHLRLYAPAEAAFTLSILDLNGRTVYLEPFTAQEDVFDLNLPETAGLAPGMYSLVLRAGNEPVVARRFLKI